MYRQKYIFELMTLLFFVAISTSCSDWTDVRPEKVVDYENTEQARPDSYYEALRSYKKSDHSISFGWYSGWSDASASTTSMLSGVPDSMDIVSLWNNSNNLSPSQIKDLEFVQKVKGTKVVLCTFISNVGGGFTPEEYTVDTPTQEAFWGWVDGDEVAIKASIIKYARAMRDTVMKYNFDGIDIDFEPNVDNVYGKLDENDTYATWFLEEISQHLGPQSNSGKMLILDGELWEVAPHTGPFFNYFVAQAYSVSGGTPPPSAGQSESNMNSRLERIIGVFTDVLTAEEVTNRFVVTENLESAIDALNGGYYWTLYNGVRQDKKVCPSMAGMAAWQPANGFRKGGFGAYQFGYEAVNSPSYKWMRTGIQLANPAMF